MKRKQSLLLLLTCTSLVGSASSQSLPKLESGSYRGWKTTCLSNGLVQVHVVPEIGGRVVQFMVGERGFFWVNPALAGTYSPASGLGPDGGWLNYGGDKVSPREPLVVNMTTPLPAKAVLLVNEVGADNLGVTLDYGHALFAKENAAESLCLINRAKKLYNVHFNDAYGTDDDDLIAGSVNIWSTLEFFWYLKQSEYDGYITLDMFPYREDPFEACGLAVRMIKTLEDIVEGLEIETIRKYQDNNDAAGVLEYLRQKVLLKK